MWCQAFTKSFPTEKAFAGHMFTVGCIFCRPGISHLAVYFIYEYSVASETKMRNEINQIKFRGSCFYITHNNTFCFTVLKIMKSVHRQPPVLKQAETSHMSKCNISVLLKCFKRGYSYIVKIPWGMVLLMKLYRYSMSSIYIKNIMKWENNMSSMYKHTNRVNHIVINRIFSVIHCSVGGRNGIFNFFPVTSILVPR